MCQESHSVGEILSLEDPQFQLKLCLWLDLVSLRLQMVTNQFRTEVIRSLTKLFIYFFGPKRMLLVNKNSLETVTAFQCEGSHLHGDR